ncbi:MAG: hypothetical protein HY294_03600 [Candidatus Rokubacteria bacterium]|nr:hypothetical protein [Candidatus Rokubacteria bacterium]MBI3825060.1 hypothetical protein [Candidatus Rokubacteria bacterium]
MADLRRHRGERQPHQQLPLPVRQHHPQGVLPGAGAAHEDQARRVPQRAAGSQAKLVARLAARAGRVLTIPPTPCQRRHCEVPSWPSRAPPPSPSGPAHPGVAEAAVIARPHEIKGQAIAAFVTVKGSVQATDALKDEIKARVAKKIGALARPDDVIYAAELPKTRSGTIMRRLLRDVAEGRALGDTTTLADPNVVATLKKQYEDKE